MRNIIITALLVSNCFTAGLLWSFACGKVERHQEDYLTTISNPVHLTRR